MSNSRPAKPDDIDANSGAPMRHNASHASCDHCGGQFTVKRRWQRFCGNRCRKLFHESKVGGGPIAKQLGILRAELAEVRARLTAIEVALRGGRLGGEVAPSTEDFQGIQGHGEGDEGDEGRSRAHP